MTSRRARAAAPKLPAAPKLVARTWAVAKREGDAITEGEVTVLLADFATVWSELFPAEQARIAQLLVAPFDLHEDALRVRIRAEGLANLVAEFLAGRTDQGMLLEQLARPLPASWEEQRRNLFPTSDASPRPPSLSDRQFLRPWGEHVNMR